MSKLVKLKDTKGNTLHLNPDHVVLVSGTQKNGVPVLQESIIMLLGGSALEVSGSPQEVAEILNNPDSKSTFYANLV